MSGPDPILAEGIEAITDAYKSGNCLGIIGFSLYRDADGSVTSRQVIACAGVDPISLMAGITELNLEIKKLLLRTVDGAAEVIEPEPDFGPAVYVERPGRGNA